MDVLLQNRPCSLPNENREMFDLMDRFFSFVDRYKNDYANLVRTRDNDLAQRTQNMKKSLSNLSDMQRNERENEDNSYKHQKTCIEDEIEKKRNYCRSTSDEYDRSLSEFFLQVDNKYNEEKNSKSESLAKCKLGRDYIITQYRNLEVQLGKNLGGVSKVQAIVSSCKDRLQIENLDDAIDAISKERAELVENLIRDIYKINATVPKKIIFNENKKSKVRAIYKYMNQAIDAVEMMESNVNALLEQMQSDCQIEKNDRRVVIDNEKKLLKEDFDKFLADRNNRLQIIASEHQNRVNLLKASHTKTYASKEEEFKNQINIATNEWDNKINNLTSNFVANIDKEFPPTNFNYWMKQFWYYPQTVEMYSNYSPDSYQKNVLIGNAMVDISDFFIGETSDTIKSVFSKYVMLFGLTQAQMAESFSKAVIILPYSISLEEGTSLLLSHDDSSFERAKAVVNAISMRKLRSVPATLMRFLLFDTQGVGGFAKLMALDPAILNNPNEASVKSIAIGEGTQIFSDGNSMATQLNEMKTNMDDLSRNMINFSSLRAFNESNPLSKQFFRSLNMLNFPTELGERQVRIMSALNKDCSHWGFSMVLAQPDKASDIMKPEVANAVNELSSHVICLRMDKNLPLRILNPKTRTEKKSVISIFGLPDDSKVSDIVSNIRKRSVDASQSTIDFIDSKDICTQPDKRYTFSADNGIQIPIGYLQGGQVFSIPFDDQHVSAMIMGNTGSGKTNFLHVLMTNLMLRYNPREVRIFLIDFKFGKDFRIYTNYNLPNFSAISVNEDPEFALALLQKVYKEGNERSSKIGSDYQNIAEYNRANPNDKIPRLLVIMDEVYELVKQASSEISEKILRLIDTCAHRGRAFGIHLIVSGQDLDKIGSFETIKNQCRIRIAMHCKDDNLVKCLMSDEGVARMHSIEDSDRGSCVYSLSEGSDPKIEHTVRISGEQQVAILKEISDFYTSKKIMTNVKILLTKVQDNPKHPFQQFVTSGRVLPIQDCRLLVGEPISMERELYLCPDKNLWVVGGYLSEKSNNAGNSLMTFAAMSLALANLNGKQNRIICTNCCDDPLRSIEDEENDKFGKFTSSCSRFFEYGNSGSYMNTLNDLCNELDARRSGLTPVDKQIWWLLIQPEKIAAATTNSQAIIDLKELLQSGSKYGIQVVMWNANVQVLTTMQIDRNLFNDRVCLEMQKEDLKRINGSDLQRDPADFKASYTGRNTSNFSVYELPEDSWLDKAIERLK